MDMFLVGKGFVGFQNYIEAFADKRLWNSLWVTIRFTLIEVTVQMVVGLVLAALLTRKLHTKAATVGINRKIKSSKTTGITKRYATCDGFAQKAFHCFIIRFSPF